MKTVYLSGAIQNDKRHQIKFKLWKQEFQKAGVKVLSPIDTKEYKSQKQDIKDCLFASLRLMQKADYLVQLDDPAISQGMQIEELIAKYCGITIISKVGV